MEQTFLMIKPDGVQRSLIGEIVSKFEKKGYKLIAAKYMVISIKIAEAHYEEHVGKPFYDKLVEFITSGPVFAMVWEGEQIIEEARRMMGKTNPLEADLASIRGQYGTEISRNIVHGSDSVNNAKREINLFFTEDEMLS